MERVVSHPETHDIVLRDVRTSDLPLLAKDNHGSLRVLEKCGFTRIGEDKGFSNARSQEIEEYILRLD